LDLHEEGEQELLEASINIYIRMYTHTHTQADLHEEGKPGAFVEEFRV
jgi:hypothetical protein